MSAEPVTYSPSELPSPEELDRRAKRETHPSALPSPKALDSRGTSKWANLRAAIGDAFLGAGGMGEGGNVDVANAGMAMRPGRENALEQTGGDPHLADALQQRALGLGTNIAITTLPAGRAFQMTKGLAMVPALLEGAMQQAGIAGIGAATEGIVGGHSSAETSNMMGDAMKWGGAVGGVLGAANSGLNYGFERLLRAGNAGLVKLDDVAQTLGTLDSKGQLAAVTDATEAGRRKAIELALAARKEFQSIVAATAPMTKTAVKRDLEVRRLLMTHLGIDPYGPPLTGEELWVMAKEAGKGLYRLASSVKRRPTTPPPPAPLMDNPVAVAARKAFNEALPVRSGGHYLPKEIEAAKAAGRQAARIEKLAQFDKLAGRLSAATQARDMLPLSTRTLSTEQFGAAAKTIQFKLLYDVGDMLRQSRMFGSIGPLFANALDQSASMAERAAGAWITHFQENVATGLSKIERDQLGRVLDGSFIGEIPMKLAQRAAQWKSIWDHVATEAEQRGIHMIDQDLTRLAATSKPGISGLRAVWRGAQEAGITELKPFLKFLDGKVDAKGFAALRTLFEDGGKFEGDALMVPFRRMATAMPVRFNPKYLAKVAKAGSAEQEAVVAEYVSRHGGTPEDARRFIMDSLIPSIDAPFEARGGSLQWSRTNLLNQNERVYDINEVLPHYLDAAARRLASAHVFGASDEVADAMRQQLKWEVAGAHANEKMVGPAMGVSRSEPGADAGPEVLHMFDKIWKASQGRHAPYSMAEKVLKGVAALRFLSPKTMMLQFTQLQNPAAEFGMVNTLKGVVGAGTNKMLRRIGRVVGATLPDIRGEIAGETLSGMIEKANPSIKGIRATDAFTRSVASIAAGLHAEELATQLVREGSAMTPGRVAAANKLRDVFGLDAELIAKQGGQLTDEQLRTAALHGSNMTMFANRVQNLPYSRLSQLGRITSVLQNYGSMQAKFFNTRILGELRRGNVAPLARGLAAMGIIGYPAMRIQAMLTDKPVEAQDYFINAYAGGMMGSFGKFLTLATHRDFANTDIFAGAGLSATAKIVQGGLEFGAGKPAKAWKAAGPEAYKQTINMAKALTKGVSGL